jgi:hypothetical protein
MLHIMFKPVAFTGMIRYDQLNTSVSVISVVEKSFCVNNVSEIESR